ncbi:MAG: tRNA 4-thiouridine(8) synthase ThiI, partial [Ignavibacteria bacterium]
MQPAIVVHHHEITLKGENRRLFERQLMKNVRNSLSGLVPASSIHGGYGRFIVELGADEAASRVEARLGTLFGISNIC